MQKRIDMLALSYGLDNLCAENDINPAVIVQWLVEEGHLDLTDYFDDGEDE